MGRGRVQGSVKGLGNKHQFNFRWNAYAFMLKGFCLSLARTIRDDTNQLTSMRMVSRMTKLCIGTAEIYCNIGQLENQRPGGIRTIHIWTKICAADTIIVD